MSMSPGDEAYVAGVFDDWDDAVRDFFTNSPQMLDDAWTGASDHAQTLRGGLVESLGTWHRFATAPIGLGDTLAAWDSAMVQLNGIKARCDVACASEYFPASDRGWEGGAAEEYRSVFSKQSAALGALALVVEKIVGILAEVEKAKDKKSSDLASVRNTGMSGVLGSACGGPWGLLVGGSAMVGYVAAEVDSIEDAFDKSVREAIRNLGAALTYLPVPWPRADGSLDGNYDDRP